MRKFFLLLIACAAYFVSQSQSGKSVSVKNGTRDKDSLFYSKIKYRFLRPFRGGRSAAVTVSYKNKNTFYFGATGGGVSKTTEVGNNWENISEKDFGGSMGAVAVAPGDENIIYVGEGENSLRGNAAEGVGI
jgi:hypothetical protein